jgi:hypothetical protein
MLSIGESLLAYTTALIVAAVALLLGRCVTYLYYCMLLGTVSVVEQLLLLVISMKLVPTDLLWSAS